MNDDIELVLCNEGGEQIAIGAMNVQTGFIDHVCLPLHKEYDDWAKDMVSRGYMLCQMTIDELINECNLVGNETVH